MRGDRRPQRTRARTVSSRRRGDMYKMNYDVRRPIRRDRRWPGGSGPFAAGISTPARQTGPGGLAPLPRSRPSTPSSTPRSGPACAAKRCYVPKISLALLSREATLASRWCSSGRCRCSRRSRHASRPRSSVRASIWGCGRRATASGCGAPPASCRRTASCSKSPRRACSSSNSNAEATQTSTSTSPSSRANRSSSSTRTRRACPTARRS